MSRKKIRKKGVKGGAKELKTPTITEYWVKGGKSKGREGTNHTEC